MATTAKKVLELAASQIGVKESPANSNRVKYWGWYKTKTGCNYNGGAWCAAFVTWVLGTLSQWIVKKDIGRNRYCPDTVAWGKKKKEWHDRSVTPKPGWIVLFANRGEACHVGFVEKVLSNGSLQTIEGNTSLTSNDNGGSVMRRTRELGTPGTSWYVLGYIEPKYKKETASAPAASQGVTVELQPVAQKPAATPAATTAATTSVSKSPFSGGGKYKILRSTLNIYDGYGAKKKKVGQYKKGSTVVLDNWSKTGSVYVYGRYTGASSGKKRYIRIGTKSGKKIFAKKV